MTICAEKWRKAMIYYYISLDDAACSYKFKVVYLDG